MLTEIKNFEFTDLVGRTLIIRSFRDGGTEVIIAKDTKTKELFLLAEIHHPTPELEEGETK